MYSTNSCPGTRPLETEPNPDIVLEELRRQRLCCVRGELCEDARLGSECLLASDDHPCVGILEEVVWNNHAGPVRNLCEESERHLAVAVGEVPLGRSEDASVPVQGDACSTGLR